MQCLLLFLCLFASWLLIDVDTPEPDEKSLITYISSLYDVFPNPPSLHPLYDPDMQRKYADYRELSSSLHIWIRESTMAMQDRNFPPTLIEVKKLLVDSNRFRTEEVPPRNREKQHIARLFKEVEVNKSGKQNQTPFFFIFYQFKMKNDMTWIQRLRFHSQKVMRCLLIAISLACVSVSLVLLCFRSWLFVVDSIDISPPLLQRQKGESEFATSKRRSPFFCHRKTHTRFDNVFYAPYLTKALSAVISLHLFLFYSFFYVVVR